MKPLGVHNYYVYILTNVNKNVFYIGVTNSVKNRVEQHRADANGEKKTFAGRYNCIYVLYFERFQFINDAISREKELKGWTRAKKESLITSFNPKWEFLNLQW